MKRAFFGLATLLMVCMAAAAPAQYPPPLISPGVHADKSVTFRFRAPNAKEVSLGLEGTPKLVPAFSAIAGKRVAGRQRTGFRVFGKMSALHNRTYSLRKLLGATAWSTEKFGQPR